MRILKPKLSVKWRLGRPRLWCSCVLLCFFAACGVREPTGEFPPLVCNLYGAPIIVVGVALNDASPVSEPHPSAFENRDVQRFSVRLAVENTLRGAGLGRQIKISFFSYVGSLGGSDRLSFIRKGERDIFYLFGTGTDFRSACDYGRSCAPVVFTGRHETVEAGSAEQQAAEILLARGEGATDKQVIYAIGSYANMAEDRAIVAQVQKLARSESPAVEQAACEALQRLSLPCPTPSGRQGNAKIPPQ